MIVPPTAPRISIGAYALVMIASAKLSKRPNVKPTAHPGQSRRTAPITNPIEKRLMNAPSNAARLSENSNGIMLAADRAPYTNPEIMPSINRDMCLAPFDYVEDDL